MRVSVIGDRDTVMGFGLTGIKDLYAVDDGEGAKQALSKAMQDDGMGVIIITERYAQFLRDDIRRWREDRPVYPIIVEIQDKKGRIEREDPIRLLIKRAVGLDVSGSNTK